MEQPIRRKPRRKENSINAKQLLITAGCVIGAVALVIAACLIFGGRSANQTPEPQGRSSMPELTVGEGRRSGQSWVVETSYMDVEFSYAFSDYILVRAVNEDTAVALDFLVKTSTMEEKLYTIWFNGNAGEKVGTFDPQDGHGEVEVRVSFYSLPVGLSEDDAVTFKATQETVNDVLASMKEGPVS